MPDETGGAEADVVSALLETPAHIDVVAGFSEYRIKSANVQQCPSVKRHVTSGNVLGQLVREHDVRRSAR